VKKTSILNLNIITLAVTHFLWGFVNFVYMIQIQPYLLSIYGTSHEAARMLGTILTIGSISAVIPLLLGFCADMYGRKKFIVFGQFISIFGMIGLTLSGSDVFLSIISIIIFNIGIGFYDPPLQGLIHESSIKKRGLAYSIVYNSSSIAGIIASFLIQNEGASEMVSFFQLGCILLTGSAVINFLVLRDVRPNNKEIAFVNIFKKPISRWTAIAFALDSFSWGLPLSIANGIYIILFGVDVAFIATLSLILSGVRVILQYPAGMLVDRFGRFFGLIIGQITGILWIIMIFSALADPNIAPELLVFAYALLGISIAFWMPSVTLTFIKIDPSAVSTNFGILSFIQRLGGVPSAVVAGFIFSVIGFPPLLIMTFTGTLIVIAIFIKIDKLEKNQLPENMQEGSHAKKTAS
jgi:MFS family permease